MKHTKRVECPACCGRGRVFAHLPQNIAIKKYGAQRGVMTGRVEGYKTKMCPLCGGIGSVTVELAGAYRILGLVELPFLTCRKLRQQGFQLPRNDRPSLWKLVRVYASKLMRLEFTKN